jgi:hypothetical protein
MTTTVPGSQSQLGASVLGAGIGTPVARDFVNLPFGRRLPVLVGFILLPVVSLKAAGQGGVDYDGHSFVTNPAPLLHFRVQDRPRLHGIDYHFPEQTAHGVALLARFPPFRLSDRRIHVDGPWYDNDAANLHFSRGITTIGAIPRYREQADAATNLRRQPQSRKWMLLTDPVWYAAAARLASELAQKNAADPRIPALRLLSEKHCYTNDRAAYLELGRFTFASERWSTDANGHFVGFPAIDIETTDGFQHPGSHPRGLPGKPRHSFHGRLPASHVGPGTVPSAQPGRLAAPHPRSARLQRSFRNDRLRMETPAGARRGAALFG